MQTKIQNISIFRVHILLFIFTIISLAGCAPESKPPIATQIPSSTPIPIPATSTIVATTPPDTKADVTKQEFQIPPNYTTYADEFNSFNISYPSNWQLIKKMFENITPDVKNYLTSSNKDVPFKVYNTIFVAGGTNSQGAPASCNIGIEPTPVEGLTIDQATDLGIQQAKKDYKDYYELSRTQATVNGRKTILTYWNTTITGLSKLRFIQAPFVVNKGVWTITCGCKEETYSDFEKDLDSIIRSFKILQ